MVLGRAGEFPFDFVVHCSVLAKMSMMWLAAAVFKLSLLAHVPVDADTFISSAAKLHNNHKDLGVYIETKLGKSYLCNLLPEAPRQAAETAMSKDSLKAIVDDLEEANKKEVLALARDVVTVRAEVMQQAKKRVRRAPPPATGHLLRGQ